jgi:hypothetical protein
MLAGGRSGQNFKVVLTRHPHKLAQINPAQKQFFPEPLSVKKAQHEKAAQSKSRLRDRFFPRSYTPQPRWRSSRSDPQPLLRNPESLSDAPKAPSAQLSWLVIRGSFSSGANYGTQPNTPRTPARMEIRLFHGDESIDGIRVTSFDGTSRQAGDRDRDGLDSRAAS